MLCLCLWANDACTEPTLHSIQAHLLSQGMHCDTNNAQPTYGYGALPTASDVGCNGLWWNWWGWTMILERFPVLPKKISWSNRFLASSCVWTYVLPICPNDHVRRYLTGPKLFAVHFTVNLNCHFYLDWYSFETHTKVLHITDMSISSHEPCPHRLRTRFVYLELV